MKVRIVLIALVILVMGFLYFASKPDATSGPTDEAAAVESSTPTDQSSSSIRGMRAQ